jgi:hypothetical protein
MTSASHSPPPGATLKSIEPGFEGNDHPRQSGQRTNDEQYRDGENKCEDGSHGTFPDARSQSRRPPFGLVAICCERAGR